MVPHFFGLNGSLKNRLTIEAISLVIGIAQLMTAFLYLDNDVPKIFKFRLSQTSDFQISITQKWLKISMSFFLLLKIHIYFELNMSELNMALISCPNIKISPNDFWKKSPKSWDSVLELRSCQFQTFLSILKKWLTLKGCSIRTTQPTVNRGSVER